MPKIEQCFLCPPSPSPSLHQLSYSSNYKCNYITKNKFRQCPTLIISKYFYQNISQILSFLLLPLKKDKFCIFLMFTSPSGFFTPRRSPQSPLNMMLTGPQTQSEVIREGNFSVSCRKWKAHFLVALTYPRP